MGVLRDGLPSSQRPRKMRHAALQAELIVAATRKHSMKRGAILATLLAAILAAQAAAAVACDAPGWEALAPEDLPPYVLNATLGEFERQFVPSEENPDDGKRLVWLPCPEELGVEVESACEQVNGDVAVYQLVVALNCTHEAPYPHTDTAVFAANVTLAPEEEAVTFSDVEIQLDAHGIQPCDDELCAICASDPKTCDECTRGTERDPSTGACRPLATDAPGATGSSAGPSKSCPEGFYWVGGDVNTEFYCNPCNRPGCSDCAYCNEAIYGPQYCWQNQYCVSLASAGSSGRPCLDGYHWKNGGCTLCKTTIPNCAFCNACPPGTPKCINGAACVQCQPGYTIGPLGYCRLVGV